MPRIVLAVLAGVATWTVLALGADALLMRAAPGAFGPGGRAGNPALLLLTLAYSLGFAALAGYVAARLSPGAERRSVPALAGVMLLLTLGSVVQLWDTAPAWYHAASLVLLAPAVLLGGRARAASPRAA